MLLTERGFTRSSINCTDILQHETLKTFETDEIVAPTPHRQRKLRQKAIEGEYRARGRVSVTGGEHLESNKPISQLAK
jgi:hypothetical protein